MNNELDLYFKEIEKIPLLTPAEEKEIAARAFKGDRSAREKLVKANLRFAVKIAHSYKNCGLDVEDLVNEANIGLMEAASRFNPECGTRFVTYAVWWIKACVHKAIRETSKGIKFPAHMYKEMQSPDWNFLSLDEAVKCSESDSVPRYALIEDDRILTAEEEFENASIVSEVHSLLECLTEKECRIISMRYGLDNIKPMSLFEVSDVMGCCRERVRQIEARALQKMRACYARTDVVNGIAA